MLNKKISVIWIVALLLLPVHGAGKQSTTVFYPVPEEGVGGAGPTLIEPDLVVPQRRPSASDRFKTALEGMLIKVGVNHEFARRNASWIICAPVFLLVALVILLKRPRRRKEPVRAPALQAPRPKLKSKKQPHPSTTWEIKAASVSDKQRVLRFFFNLFKNQIGCAPDAPTELYLVEKRSTCPDETYEMRIQQNGDWISRRMSIGLLGQGGGSRSRCFLVTYDSHMVVKIPADPIATFHAYDRQIAAEAAIVARLAPRECIVPKVSVILKTVHSISNEGAYTPDELEKKYVHLVEVKPVFQEYLKIGASFAFFMDLAKHFFLSTTLEEIHASRQIKLVDEALRHQELLWDQHGFICRYGEEAGMVCHVLQDAFYRCEKALRSLVDEAAIVEDVPSFRLKQWFLIHLAAGQIEQAKVDLPASLVDKANALLKQVMADNQQVVDQYRDHLKAYIFETRFSRNRTQLESLATNTLDLLAWISGKGLALRDLKPENLFVAGNPDEYPLFLADAANFSIGLIDVETAVVIDAEDPKKIPQPQLAGTPLYATPTHLMSNTILREVYPDLAAILRAQDWYATVAIIFKIFTGENLFANTARVFPQIIKRLKLIDPAGSELSGDVAAIHRLFWNSAFAELREALIKHAAILTRVDVAIPKAFIPDIIKALHRDIDHIKKTISRMVGEQPFFSDAKKRRYLLDASSEKIRQMKHKLIHESQKGRQYEQILMFFSRLQGIKGRLQRKLEAAALLKATGAPISAEQLLEAMLQQVFSIMYLSDWPPLSPAKWGGAGNLPVDITAYQATL